MLTMPSLSVTKVSSLDQRADALKVLKATYRREKRWVSDEAVVFPESDLGQERVSWFLVYANSRPAGVLRVLYDPQLGEYSAYQLEILQPGVDIESFLKSNRVAEIGRFAVSPRYRRHISVVTLLIKAASEDTVRKGYRYYITDVFEGERHSPLNFHTRVLGFTPVATHETGEMKCRNRRITLLLNLAEAYKRLRFSRTRLYRFLTEGWDEALHKSLLAE